MFERARELITDLFIPPPAYAPLPKERMASDRQARSFFNSTFQTSSNSKKVNGFGEAIGYSDYGFSETPQGTALSQVNSLFHNNRWYLVSNMRQLLNELYVEHGLIQTIVNVPVDDGFRGGIEIVSKQLSEDQLRELQISLDRDDDINTVAQAIKWNRLFGGAGIIIMTDQDPSTPLDLNAIRKGSPLTFRAVDLWELFWTAQNVESYDPEIQYQDFEYYNYYAKVLHKSRVMRLTGQVAPSFIRPRLRGWGFSVVEHLVRSVNQYLKATNLSYEVLDEFKIDIFKIKNLTDTLFSPDGSAQVNKRIKMANWQKNFQHAMVMDSEDDYIQKQLSFAGLSETMKEIRMQIAADMRMPLLKLFGIGASGLNASSEDEIEVYNAMVESEVRNKSKYDILRVCEIKCQYLFGFIPDDMEIKFKPLRVMSSVEEENVKTQKFARLIQAKSAGEISTYEFRDACNRDQLFGIQLDTAGDKLNPDDPEVQDLVEKTGVYAQPDVAAGDGSPDPKSTTGPSIEDPGANRQDTSNPRPQIDARKKSNSAAFDRASYQADGGSAWLDPKRIAFLMTITKDEPEWSDAVAKSMKAYGELNPAFAVWYYHKNGGRL